MARAGGGGSSGGTKARGPWAGGSSMGGMGSSKQGMVGAGKVRGIVANPGPTELH